MPTAYEQKVAFDAVDDATPISADQIAELVRNFAVVSNKPREARLRRLGNAPVGHPQPVTTANTVLTQMEPRRRVPSAVHLKVVLG